jgi:S1-C subfamily serine protease
MKKQPTRWFILAGLVLILFLGCFGVVVVSWLMFRSVNRSLYQASVGATAIPAPTATLLPLSSGINELEAQMVSIYQRVGPGVVNITNRSFELDFFLRPVPREGSGSGFFYDTNGNIVTNYHVIQNAEELYVTLANGQSLPAQVVGSDPSNDLAVIHIDTMPADVSALTIANSRSLQVGRFVVAIGNPFGLEGTLTLGVVSSLGRVIESPNQRFIGEVIQTDTAINPGNSGGPLLNLAGEVIGVNSAILSPSGASAGIGFAIPARTVQRVVPELIKQGHYPHPSLGGQFYELKPELARLLQQAGMDVPVDQGLLVIKSQQGGILNNEGLREGTRQVRVGNVIVPVGGDIIIAINGTSVGTLRDMIVFLETQTAVGDQVNVTVIRDGEQHVLPITLVEM